MHKHFIAFAYYILRPVAHQLLHYGTYVDDIARRVQGKDDVVQVLDQCLVLLF